MITLFIVTGCSKDNEQSAGGFQAPPTPVESALVTLAPVTDSFSTVGSLEAGEAIMVTTEIDGMVTAIPFREGGSVAEGDLIAQLDDAQLKAEVQRANALFAQSKATWDRVKSIVDQGAGAPQDLDDALAALKVAEANLALAQTRLDKTRITAPFSGLTGKRKISRGSFLRAGSAITSLAQIENLRVTFAIPERILASLKVGAEVRVTTTAFANKPLIGTIDVIEPQLNALTRNVAVVALIENRDGLLRPGMSATINVVLNQRAEALTVPSEAVFVQGGQSFVFVIKPDSTVTRTSLSLGTRLKAVVEVVEGLLDGQHVVKAGHQKLYEGAKVAPIPAKSAEGGIAQ